MGQETVSSSGSFPNKLPSCLSPSPLLCSYVTCFGGVQNLRYFTVEKSQGGRVTFLSQSVVSWQSSL